MRNTEVGGIGILLFGTFFCRISAKSCADDCQAAQGERCPGVRLLREGGG